MFSWLLRSEKISDLKIVRKRAYNRQSEPGKTDALGCDVPLLCGTHMLCASNGGAIKIT